MKKTYVFDQSRVFFSLLLFPITDIDHRFTFLSLTLHDSGFFLMLFFKILREILTRGRPELMPPRKPEFNRCVVNRLIVWRAHFSRVSL